MSDEGDEEEEECRVCRGPAEEGRPLFQPCKCSGSIGLVHQDCLRSWLEVTRGDGRCELCGTRFAFVPRYAPDAPDRLSPGAVAVGLLRRLGATWVPLGLRALFAASLWLGVLPLATAYVYHGWMDQPAAVAGRWTWDLAKRDAAGGAVIAVVIVISCLSLVSFVEYLRFQWGGVQPPRPRRGAVAREGAAEGEIDEIRVPRYPVEPLEPAEPVEPAGPAGPALDLAALARAVAGEWNTRPTGEPAAPALDQLHASNEESEGGAGGERGARDDAAGGPPAEEEEQVDDDEDEVEDEEAELEAFMRAQEEQEEEHQREHDPEPHPRDDDEDLPPNPPAGHAPAPRPGAEAGVAPQLDPFADLDAQEDGAEEIQVALDELLGFRGPLLSLVRNLLWLLAFNTAYLGVFAFAPAKFGGSLYAALARLPPLLPPLPPALDGAAAARAWLVASARELDAKSRETRLIYQPDQVVKMGLGYAAFFVLLLLLKALVGVATRGPAAPRAPREEDGERGRDDAGQDALPEGAGREEDEDDGDEDPIGKRFLDFLGCVGAVAKVVTLLFVKMFLLPLLLGVWLDLATLSLFEKTWSDRLAYAGTDLCGSIILHWVTGITVMLLVTMSLLQLREVVHPAILARFIKPQEPQPDLLGNLLQESGVTHTKRVLESIVVYAALLALHVWLPARLLLRFNLGKYLPFFQPKFCYILMPQIQVPVELLIFHVCTLGVLEKHKNKIGEMQHHWLLMMGHYLGLTDQILPREINTFTLLGNLPVFAEDASPNQLENTPSDGLEEDHGIFPVWNHLLAEKDASKRKKMLQSSIHNMDTPEIPRYNAGTVQSNGKKLLSSHAYIRLPSSSSTSGPAVNTSGKSDSPGSNLLPTSIGPYRLKQGISKERVTVIEVWREEAGKAIPRPPEGWDDLDVGGAERHGRWAWGDESPSEIENNVAARTPFFQDPEAEKWEKASTLIRLSFKMLLLLLVSWFVTSVVLCAVTNIPLYNGHFALYLLRVPDSCVHDPLAFIIGVLLLVPMVGTIAKLFAASNNGIRGVFSLLLNWATSFKPHHTHEKVKTLLIFLVLWLGVCPVQVGFLHSSFFVGIRHSSGWHAWHANAYSILVNWGTGTLILNSWAAMCYFQVFTTKFWADIVMGDGQGDRNENQDVVDAGARQGGINNPPRDAVREDNAQGIGADETRSFTWQGKDGAIARAVESIMAFTLGWEWDKVDKQSLLQDCALPVSKHLMIACAVPIAALSLALALPLASVLGRQLELTALFRIVVVTSIVIDFVCSSKHSLRVWFQAAHRIARDDQYLIGEILLNYSPIL